MHTGGEPLRVLISGLSELRGSNILEYRRDMMDHYDYIRTAIIHEPRGHKDMYGCIIVPPNDSEADFGILFMHNEGYSTMCGHAIIAITKLAVMLKWVPTTGSITKVTIDAPCGRIYSYARIEGADVISVYFDCVPSFVLHLNQTIRIPGQGDVNYDISYGGAFYAYVDADKQGIDLNAVSVSEITDLGMSIKQAIIAKGPQIAHPYEADLSFLYGTIFYSRYSGAADSKNVCVFADGEVDRSPTGSGVAGRMALHWTRREIAMNSKLHVESIAGSVFTGSIVRTLDYGPYQAVIPRIEGNAYIVGKNEFLIDPSDPMKHGFIIN